MMNILVLNPILFTADNNRIPTVVSIKDTMIYNMCLGFKQLGHDITLMAACDYKPVIEEEYDFQIIFFKTNLRKIFLPSVLPFSVEMYSYIKANRSLYDMILVSESFSVQAFFAAVLAPDKTLIWQELTQHQNKLCQIPSRVWHRFVAPVVLRKVRIVVARSEKAKIFISRYLKNVSSTIVEHGINIDKFSCSTSKKRMLITSSQLIYRKNVDGIVKIFSRFSKFKGYEDVKLLIAGRGEERPALEQLVSDLLLQDKVCFLGFVSQQELNTYIKESLCFLVNTRKDLNMVSIPESIVSGTPILTNKQPVSSLYVNEYNLGIVKDEWNEYDIKNIIDNNSYYVSNCISYRAKLTNIYSARKLIEIFELNIHS